MPKENLRTDDMSILMRKHKAILNSIVSNDSQISFIRLCGTRENFFLISYRDEPIAILDSEVRTKYGIFGTMYVSDIDAKNALTDLPRGTLYQPAADGSYSVYNYHPKWYVRKYVKGLESFDDILVELEKAIVAKNETYKIKSKPDTHSIINEISAVVETTKQAPIIDKLESANSNFDLNKDKVLLVSVKGSYNEARKSIKKKIIDANYRVNLRDMTVQYWKVNKVAPRVGIVCGIRGNKIYSAYQVNEHNSYDEVEYETRTDFSKTIRIAFNCDVIRYDLIGIKLPDEIAFNGGNLLRTVDISKFYDLVSNQLNTEELENSKMDILNQIETDGLDLDYEDHKRRDYHNHTDFAQPEYGTERDHTIVNKALKRANYKCELMECYKCSFCDDLKEIDRTRLEVHHINELHESPDENDTLDNMIAICRTMHRKYHYHMEDSIKVQTKVLFSNVRNAHK